MFYTDEGWQDAGDLDEGDLLLSLDGEYDAVEAIEVEHRTDTMYDLTVDAVHTFAVGDGQWVVHNCDPRKILVLGEEANAPYARWLADEHPDWQIWGTKYGDAEQILVESIDNLRIVHNVDGRRLEYGDLTRTQQFSDIVFNAPRSHAPVYQRAKHRDMLIDVLKSSRYVLRPNGFFRVSSTTGMPAGWFLQGFATSNPKSVDLLPSFYSFVHGGKGAPTKGRPGYSFFGDRDFGWSDYRPRENGGEFLDEGTAEEMYWYLFQLSGS